ncbi:MAG TPA: trigger factor [Cyanobacteria bacterium UBA9971]|nr:trigger factor [Cyanobacteria bacterium UBA9971]
MKVNLEKQENNLFKLSIEIDADVAAQEYNKACRKTGENINIPGFRKGKAPRSMIEKHVGVGRIQQKVLDALLPNIFADLISEHQFDLATEPVVENYNFELGKPVTVTARLEIKPEVNLVNHKGQVIEVPEFKHSDDVIEKELKLLSEKFATLEPIVGRPAEVTDIVIIDFTGTVNGEPIKGGAGKNQQLDLSNSHFIKGFAEQTVGKSIGEEFTINVTFPEDYQDKVLSGKPAEFKIKINEIKKKITPEVNDELAQKVGPFQTLDDLKADMAKYLEKARENENKIRTEKAVLEKVVDSAKVDIPDSMVNREAKTLLEEIQARFKSQGISWDQVLEQQGHENTWNSLREEAAKRVRTSLVLSAVAKTENIQLTEEDFLEKVRELARTYNSDEKAIYEQMAQNPALAQGLSQQIMSQKIINYLLENNEVKYIEDTLAKV